MGHPHQHPPGQPPRRAHLGGHILATNPAKPHATVDYLHGRVRHRSVQGRHRERARWEWGAPSLIRSSRDLVQREQVLE
jgi:hypothetical protein